jgi:hypothetical protein
VDDEKIAGSATLAVAAPPVRVTLPAKVAFDLDAFQKTLINLAERLGCRPCLSGRACLFTLERDFIVDPAGGIDAVGGFGA